MAESKKTYLFYKREDFLLYLFSLILVQAVGMVAFRHVVPRVLLGIGLSYMALTFVQRHGLVADWRSLLLVPGGLVRWVGAVAVRTSRTWRRQLVAVALFGGIVAAEFMLRERLGADGFWMRPFPYEYVVWGCLAVIVLAKTSFLVAHLKRADVVEEVLLSSEWRREMRGLSPKVHIVRAYVCGVIASACGMMPFLIFWHLTAPTYFREVALLAASLIFAPWWAGRERMRRHDVPFMLPALLLNTYVLVPADEMDEGLYVDHQRWHTSRVAFTVLHGHHHDAIPSALIGGPGYGFGEALHESTAPLMFLRGNLFAMPLVTFGMLVDMVGHQYIPGVPPFSRTVVAVKVHHMVHHYGSVRPLGLTGAPYRRDIENGYDPDNKRVRWFIDAVRKYEGVDEKVLEGFERLDEPVVGLG